MSNETVSGREFNLTIIVVVAVCLVIGGITFAVFKTAELKKVAEVKKVELIQDAKNERNKERWASLPFLRNKKEEK